MMRRLLLAAGLALSLAGGAAAQSPYPPGPPPPVPGLPDSARQTTYTISATTCACAVGFQLYGDSTDFQDWIEVWLNGTPVQYNDPTYGWSVSSPTGALATIPRPITDAVVTFNNAQTGTVVIVGARRPRRTTEFSENTGVPARSLNQTFNDLYAIDRETWDKINDISGRGLFFPPGNTTGPMPSPSACANAFLAFDATGLNPVCISNTVPNWNITYNAPGVAVAVNVDNLATATNSQADFGASLGSNIGEWTNFGINQTASAPTAFIDYGPNVTGGLEILSNTTELIDFGPSAINAYMPLTGTGKSLGSGAYQPALLAEVGSCSPTQPGSPFPSQLYPLVAYCASYNDATTGQPNNISTFDVWAQNTATTGGEFGGGKGLVVAGFGIKADNTALVNEVVNIVPAATVNSANPTGLEIDLGPATSGLTNVEGVALGIDFVTAAPGSGSVYTALNFGSEQSGGLFTQLIDIDGCWNYYGCTNGGTPTFPIASTGGILEVGYGAAAPTVAAPATIAYGFDLSKLDITGCVLNINISDAAVCALSGAGAGIFSTINGANTGGLSIVGGTSPTSVLYLKSTSNASPTFDEVITESSQFIVANTAGNTEVFDCNYVAASRCTIEEPALFSSTTTPTLGAGVAITGELSSLISSGLSAGYGAIYSNGSDGIAIQGDGTIYNFVLLNSAGSIVCEQANGTSNFGCNGSITGSTLIPASSSAPTNGLYLPATNTPAVAANSTEAMSWSSTLATAYTALQSVAAPTVASSASAVLDTLAMEPKTTTISGSTNITTAGGFNPATLYQQTYTASSALTVSYAATLAIEGPPIAGTDVTITNDYALWVKSGVSVFAGEVFAAEGNTDYIILAGGGTGSSLSTNAGPLGFEPAGTLEMDYGATNSGAWTMEAALYFSALPTGTASTYACFTSGKELISSSSAC